MSQDMQIEEFRRNSDIRPKKNIRIDLLYNYSFASIPFSNYFKYDFIINKYDFDNILKSQQYKKLLMRTASEYVEDLYTIGI